MYHFGFIVAALLFFLGGTNTAVAADQNGYVAQYECRAGNPYCNVDVATLATSACNQTVSVSTPWSSINWSNRIICIQAGDHTAKGALTIPSAASGSAGNYKVLRYYRAGDTNDDPWDQSSANQARLARVVIDGADYWLIDRLTLPAVSAAETRVALQRGNNNVVLNRVLIEGSGFSGTAYGAIGATDCNQSINNFTLQNSVVRRFYGAPGVASVGVSLPCQGSNIRVVNNELYDWSEHPIQIGRNQGPTLPGFVVENNDIYNSPAMHTQNGTKSRAQSLLVAKADGTSASPARITHNRIWGARYADNTVCCDWGAPGRGIIINGGNGQSLEYIAVTNNIVFDSQQGIAVVVGPNEPNARRNSIVGNLFYKIEPFCTGTSCQWDAIEVGDMDNAEIYLNTIIGAKGYSITDESQPNNDLRCNVFIDSGRRRGGATAPASYQADNNAFYGTPVISFNGNGSHISGNLGLRANSTAYRAGDVVRLGSASQCTSETDAACFMYKALAAGTSDASSPQACTTLGCTFSDGAVVWQAFRGPYAFWRKLKTTPERVVIPYAQPHSSAAEAFACSADYASRTGIGINDER